MKLWEETTFDNLKRKYPPHQVWPTLYWYRAWYQKFFSDYIELLWTCEGLSDDIFIWVIFIFILIRNNEYQCIQQFLHNCGGNTTICSSASDFWTIHYDNIFDIFQPPVNHHHADQKPLYTISRMQVQWRMINFQTTLTRYKVIFIINM